LVVHGNPLVIPAQAGIQDAKVCVFHWVPACAGMTLREREHIKTNRSHTASLAQIEKLSCPAQSPRSIDYAVIQASVSQILPDQDLDIAAWLRSDNVRRFHLQEGPDDAWRTAAPRNCGEIGE
jgi:hypothetical protein